jgi:hypothetical protein
VPELARRGVAYVTVAHLFYRDVATNAPAIPFLHFLPDWLYDRIFHQPSNQGLTERGRTIVKALTENRIMVDVSHMSPKTRAETFDLLDKLDPTMPVIASHAGYRFGGQSYMLDRPDIERIAKHDGVIGLIMAQYSSETICRSATTTSPAASTSSNITSTRFQQSPTTTTDTSCRQRSRRLHQTNHGRHRNCQGPRHAYRQTRRRIPQRLGADQLQERRARLAPAVVLLT